MTELPAYSVVIPAFNAATFILETVQSVLDQTHSPTEIIIVDDGSTDDVAAVLAGVSDKIFLHHQSNQGPAAATALGFDKARTGFVATLDADDIWHPDKLERQFTALAGMPNNAIVFTKMMSFGEGATVNESHAGWSRSTMLLAVETYNLVGPFIDMPGRRGEMVNWIASARSMGVTTKLLDEVLAKRRLHEGSLSWGRSAELDKGYLEVVRLALLRRKNKTPDV